MRSRSNQTWPHAPNQSPTNKRSDCLSVRILQSFGKRGELLLLGGPPTTCLPRIRSHCCFAHTISKGTGITCINRLTEEIAKSMRVASDLIEGCLGFWPSARATLMESLTTISHRCTPPPYRQPPGMAATPEGQGGQLQHGGGGMIGPPAPSIATQEDWEGQKETAAAAPGAAAAAQEHLPLPTTYGAASFQPVLGGQEQADQGPPTRDDDGAAVVHRGEGARPYRCPFCGMCYKGDKALRYVLGGVGMDGWMDGWMDGRKKKEDARDQRAIDWMDPSRRRMHPLVHPYPP